MDCVNLSLVPFRPHNLSKWTLLVQIQLSKQVFRARKFRIYFELRFWEGAQLRLGWWVGKFSRFVDFRFFQKAYSSSFQNYFNWVSTPKIKFSHSTFRRVHLEGVWTTLLKDLVANASETWVARNYGLRAPPRLRYCLTDRTTDFSKHKGC